MKNFKLKPKEYFLITAHKAENVDNRELLSEILNLDIGSNILVGAKAGEILEEVRKMLSQGNEWRDPSVMTMQGISIVNLIW